MIQKIIEQYGVLLGVLAMIGIEISPIKINPLKWLGKLCGKWIGIDDLSKKISKVDEKVDINERDRIRYEILQFSGSLRNGLIRTDNDYTHIEELYQKYHEVLNANSYITSEMEFIRSCKNGIGKK
jgi:hypothetical protein